VLAHLTDALLLFITQLYSATGLFGIALAMAIESCCIPLPSEIVMPVAGIMIANGTILKGTNFWLAIFLVALAGAIGCLVGSMAAYGIGYKGGRPLMLKYGRYLLISQHDADKADAFFRRWGGITAFFSRLLPVVRTYISLPAGIAEMPFAKFCIYSFLGSLPWCFLLAYLGTVLGSHLDTLSPIFHSLDVVILVAIVLLIVLYVWRHVRNDRKARAEHAAAELSQASVQSAPAPSGQGQNIPQSVPSLSSMSSVPPAVPQQQNWDQAQFPPQQPQQGRGQPQQFVQQVWGQPQQFPQQPGQPQQPSQPQKPPANR